MNTTSVHSGTGSRPRRPWRRFRIAAIVLLSTALLFAFIEGAARVYTAARPSARPSWVDLLTASSMRDGYYFLSSHELPSRPIPQRSPELTISKEPGTIRIAAFGASSVYGTPFRPDAAFPHMLLRLLRAQWPNATFEAFNFGSPGRTYYFSLQTVRDCLPLRPDYLIVLGGGNELHPAGMAFAAQRRANPLWRLTDPEGWLARRSRACAIALELGRSGRDAGENAARVDGAEQAELAGAVASAVEDFAWITDRLLAIAQECEAQVVYLTHLRNLRDFPPEPGADELPALAADEAERLAAQTDRSAAESYQLARHYDRGGDVAQARRLYEEASNETVWKVRTHGRIQEFIRGMPARYPSVMLVDVEDALEKDSPGGILGDEAMIDHCHPTLHSQFRIAQELAEALRPGLEKRLGPPTDAMPAFEDIVGQLVPDPKALMDEGNEWSGYENLTCFRWKRARSYFEKRLESGYSLLSALGLGAACMELHDAAGAEAVAHLIRQHSTIPEIEALVHGKAGFAKIFFEKYL